MFSVTPMEMARSGSCTKRSFFPKESESPGVLARKRVLPDERKAREYMWFMLLALYERKYTPHHNHFCISR